MPFGPLELTLILVIIIMLFGVGKLPEVFGSVGKGIREFRKASSDAEEAVNEVTTPPVASSERPESS